MILKENEVLRCPRCGGKTFCATAHVTQDWELDDSGTFVRCLNDCIEVFEELGWDWSYHAFREWNGWSLEHEGDNPQTMKPAGTTPRREVLLKYFKRNEKAQS